MIVLCRMRRLIKQIPPMLMDIELEEARATKITATITGMPRSTDNHSKVEDGAIKLVALRDAYAEILDELKVMREELTPLIDALENPDDRAVMRLRYINGYRPEDFAKDRYRTVRSIYYYLKRAEDTLVRTYPDKIMR